MLDHILIQVLMGGAALFAFLSGLRLLAAVRKLIQARAAKVKAETAMVVMLIAERIKRGRNGGSNA